MTKINKKKSKGKIIRLDDFVASIKDKNEADYGSPSIPIFVKIEVDIFAANQKISKKAALATMINSAGSYEKLESTLKNENSRRQRKARKVRAEAENQAKKPQNESPYTKILNASKLQKYIPVFLGGSPGLGKKK